MEFAMRTLVVFVLLIMGTVIIILFIQTWTGKSIDITQSVYDFFSNLLGMK